MLSQLLLSFWGFVSTLAARKIHSVRPRIRLLLEILEGRSLPATFTWTGKVSTDYNDPNNWNIVPKQVNFNPQPPSGQDMVIIPVLAQRSPELKGQGAAGNIEIAGGKLTVTGHLTVDGVTPPPGQKQGVFDWGQLVMNPTGVLDVCKGKVQVAQFLDFRNGGTISAITVQNDNTGTIDVRVNGTINSDLLNYGKVKVAVDLKGEKNGALTVTGDFFNLKAQDPLTGLPVPTDPSISLQMASDTNYAKVDVGGQFILGANPPGPGGIPPATPYTQLTVPPLAGFVPTKNEYPMIHYGSVKRVFNQPKQTWPVGITGIPYLGNYLANDFVLKLPKAGAFNIHIDGDLINPPRIVSLSDTGSIT